MSISSSLAAGVSGLNANANRLATISDNIANSQTYGYRRAVTDFNSLVLQSGSGTYSAGGVRTSTGRLMDQQGPIVTTANATDLAVSGRGMLPVTPASSIGNSNGGTELLLTPTGSFRADEQGYLRTNTGQVLLGWPTETDGTLNSLPRDTADALQPVQVNINQFSGDPTTRVDMGVNLPATATEALNGANPPNNNGIEELSVEYFGNLGVSDTLGVAFQPDIPADGDPPTNTWTMTITDTAANGVVIGEYTIAFNDDETLGGTLASVDVVGGAGGIGGAYDEDTGTITVTVAGRDMEIGLGRLDTSEGMTQLSNAFAPVSISKNGSPVGILTSVEVDRNGLVQALYDVGFTRTIYRVPLVDVPNLNGLTPYSNQTYGVSLDSGPFFLWNAGDGPTGEINGFSLEESATDVAAELTQLIQTQRAYSSNAKVIQTVDEMLQETTNIIR